MTAIRPIAQTDDTVTLRRTDFEKLLEAVEDADDIAVLRAAEARENEVRKAAARADYLPSELVMRLLAGEHPVRIWREHRGLSPQALADRAGFARSYLVEIEGRKKSGSISAHQKLAHALGVTIDDLVSAEEESPTS